MEPIVTHYKNGFTLVEALIALLILSILLLGLVPAFVKAYNLNYKMSLYNTGVEIAQNTLEEIRSDDFDNINSSNSTVSMKIKKADINYTVSQTVSSLYNGELKQVIVKVRWPIAGQYQDYNVTTVVGAIDE